MNPTVSLVMLCYNNWEFTKNAISTLAESFDESILQSGVEVLIIDNGSTDLTKQELQGLMSCIDVKGLLFRSVILEENMGYPVGVNIGLSMCKGEIIGVLNNDLVFPKGWISALIAVLHDDKSVGMATPYLSYALGPQNVGMTFESFHQMEAYARAFMNLHKQEVTYAIRVIGACMLFRRDLLETVGGNDFWYGVGNYDDDDWCLRTLIAGYKLAIVGGAFIEHVGHATFRTDENQFSSSLDANAVKFERKWDLSESGNQTGLYSRQGVIKHRSYVRTSDFYPVSLHDFSQSARPFFPRNSEIKRLLFAADWTNPRSDWKQVLRDTLTQDDEVEICIFIPSMYFDVADITQKMTEAVNGYVVSPSVKLTLFQDNVPPMDLLRVLRSVDSVLQVENDFVNRYLTYLSRALDLPVKAVSRIGF